MRKILFFILLLLLTACNKQNRGQETAQLTLKDSLLLLLNECYGDTVGYSKNDITGREIFWFEMGDTLQVNMQRSIAMGNKFDKLIRTPRTNNEETKVESINLINGYVIHSYSSYAWETYDYKVTLYYLFSSKYSDQEEGSLEKRVEMTFQEK